MTNAVIAALIALWILVLVLALVVVALLRQVGMLHERLGPVGALMLPGGPEVGQETPAFELEAIDGRAVRIGGAADGRSTLLFFLSPTCPVCKSLIPVVKSIAREQGDALQVVLASDGDAQAQYEMVVRERLEAFSTTDGDSRYSRPVMRLILSSSFDAMRSAGFPIGIRGAGRPAARATMPKKSRKERLSAERMNRLPAVSGLCASRTMARATSLTST